jgi:prefoldin subunit 5
MSDEGDEAQKFGEEFELNPDVMLAVDNVRRVMEAQLAQLRTQAEQLKLQQGAINKIKQRIESVSCTEQNRLKLNVGGQKFEVRASAVERNHFFKPLLSGAFSPADSSDGFHFIDRDPSFVGVIMNYLRNPADVDLEPYSVAHLERIRKDAEFYMVTGLQERVEEMQKRARQVSQQISTFKMNRDVLATRGVNGIFFQITPTASIVLTSMAFIAGETRPMVAMALFREGSIQQTGVPQFNKLGEIDQSVVKGVGVTIPLTAMTLQANRPYVIGVYSSSCPITVCAKADAIRTFPCFTVDRTYHTTDNRGQYTRKAGEDEYDFVGDISLGMI